MVKLRLDSRTGQYTKCSQYDDKVGQGRCTHVAGEAPVQQTSDRARNIIVFDISETKVDLPKKEAEKIIKRLRAPSMIPGFAAA